MTGLPRIAVVLLITISLMCGTSQGASELSPPRSLHYLKDVTFTKTSDSAKLVLSFDAPVTYQISEQSHGKRGKKLTILIQNCVINPRIERIGPDRNFIASLNATSRYNARSGMSALITISSYREVGFSWSETPNPFRIVVTMVKKEPPSPKITGDQSLATSNNKVISPEKVGFLSTPEGKPTRSDPSDKVKRSMLIVIDPGHGGKDKGATGFGGVYEKDLTLIMARSLKRIIEETLPDVKVELTRYRDEYLSLEQRVKLANSLKADLFVSLHFNAHENPSVRGIETYYLNISQDKEAARVAAIENAVLKKKMSDLEAILQDLLKASSIAESAKLARAMHGQMMEALKPSFPDVKDLGVKSAPFYVLFGITMPGVLIEAGFISNKEELNMIRSPEFTQAVAKSILQGVKLYAQEINRDNLEREGRVVKKKESAEVPQEKERKDKLEKPLTRESLQNPGP
ncbi:MAG: N-acetylmuramoyl-L-alanine amidase [Thermodesulforhabdaceae bacterium]